MYRAKVKALIFRPKGVAGQDGLASIVVVFTLVVLISLISLGFARLMNRALQVSVGNQLGAAASYAAQSGINDAIAYLQQNPATQATKCGDLLPGKINPNLSADGVTKYTCILINPGPTDLLYQNVDAFKSQVVKLTPQSGVVLDSLMFSWQASQPGHDKLVGSGQNLYDETTWSKSQFQSALRVSLYPVTSDATPLASNPAAKTFFLYPNSGSSNVTSFSFSDPAKVGAPVSVACGANVLNSFSGAADYRCNVVINNLSAAQYYYARVTPLYNQTNIKITGNDKSPNMVSFSGVQAVVDVTAKSGDALRRLQARVDFNSPDNISFNDNAIPEYGVRSANTICKRILVPSDGSLPKIDVNSLKENPLSCLLFSYLQPPPPPGPGQPPNVSLTAAPPSVSDGGSVQLSWTVGGVATSCTAGGDQPWFNVNNPSKTPPTGGSEIVGPLAGPKNYIFSITCTGPGGTSSPSSVTVPVGAPGQPPPPPGGGSPDCIVNSFSAPGSVGTNTSFGVSGTFSHCYRGCSGFGTISGNIGWPGGNAFGDNNIPFSGTMSSGSSTGWGGVWCYGNNGSSAKAGDILVNPAPAPPPPPPSPPPPSPPPPPGRCPPWLCGGCGYNNSNDFWFSPVYGDIFRYLIAGNVPTC